MLSSKIEAEDVIDIVDLPEPEPDLSEMHGAIAALFFEDPRALDARHLWTQGRRSYFRVNWWTTTAGEGSRVRRSSFVVVEREAHGYRVRDVTRREAA